MKSLKSYLLIALLSVCMLFVPSVFSSPVRPVRGIDVIVKKDPGSSARQQHVTVNEDGTAQIKLDAPGKYTVTYASGPNKGKTLWSGEVKKAQMIGLSGIQAQISAKKGWDGRQ